MKLSRALLAFPLGKRALGASVAGAALTRAGAARRSMDARIEICILRMVVKSREVKLV